MIGSDDHQLTQKLQAARTVYHCIKKKMSTLSPREAHVLDLMQRGYLNKGIAKYLDLSVRTVENVRARCLVKLEVDTANQAMWFMGQWQALRMLFEN